MHDVSADTDSEHEPMSIDDYSDLFSEEPGYLDFARVGPISSNVAEEQNALTHLLSRARFGTVDSLHEQDARVRESVTALTGFRADQVVFQPNTSQALMQAIFGLSGSIAMAQSEFPSMPFAAVRAREAIGELTVQWLETDHGRVTPGNIRDQLTDDTTAVAVSLVDFRTGYLADIEGIRQVIGDRLFIVDAIQGFGVVDAPFEVADVVASGGQKWVRSGWGTGFLALSDRALDRVTPVMSGFSATDAEGTPLDEVLPPTRGAGAFAISNADPIAQGRFAVALEDIERVGVRAIHARVLDKANHIIDLADEFGLAVLSSRAENERAGIVVIAPPEEQLTVLSASMHNHGVTATIRQNQVRLSAHVSTTDETFDSLRAAFTSYASAINV